MQCQQEEWVVVIRHPKSFGRRCGEVWTSCKSSFCCIFGIFIGLSVAFLVFGLMWVVFYCQEQPSVSLDSFSVRNMTLYQNNTIPSPQSPWQVDSGFTITLLTSNPNTVAKCFCTFRRVNVRMEYRGQLILQQEVGLGFGLKPRASQPVTVDVKGEGFQLKNSDLGPFMQNELRNGAMYFDIYFATRYLRNDRKAGWVNMGCLVQAQTPNSTQTEVSLPPKEFLPIRVVPSTIFPAMSCCSPICRFPLRWLALALLRASGCPSRSTFALERISRHRRRSTSSTGTTSAHPESTPFTFNPSRPPVGQQ